MRIKLRQSLILLGVAASISFFLFAKSPLAQADSTVTSIIEISSKALTKAEYAPIEDNSYWKVVGDDRPLASSVSSYVSSDGRFDAGVGHYARVTLEIHDWSVDAFMYILEGQVEITDYVGHSRVYGPGDAFVMPKGFRGTWKELSDVKKIHVVYKSVPE